MVEGVFRHNWKGFSLSCSKHALRFFVNTLNPGPVEESQALERSMKPTRLDVFYVTSGLLRTNMGTYYNYK